MTRPGWRGPGSHGAAVQRWLAAGWLGASLLATGCAGPGESTVADRDRPLLQDEVPPPAAPVAKSGSGARPVASESQDRALVLPRPLLQRVLDAGPGWLLGQVPLEPLFDDKRRFAGFRIVSVFGDRPEVLRYGVLPGDALLAIGKRRIVTPGDLSAAFEDLRGAQELAVTVRRAGQVREVRVPIVEAAPATDGP